jgi:hypothetical protein
MPPLMPPQQILRNERLNFLQLICATPYVIILQQYVPVLATRLGAPPLLLGILSSGAALMLTVAAVAGRWWLQRAPADMRAVVIPVIGARSIVLWVPLVLLLPSYQAEALIAIAIGTSFFLGLVQVAFLTVLPRMTLPERVSTMISGRWTVLGIGMAIGIPLMATVLDAFPRPLNYVVACSFAALTSVAESYTFMRWQPRPGSAIQRERRSVRSDLGQILHYKPGVRYLVLTMLMQFGASAIAPLVPLQLVRELHATNVQYGWYSAVSWMAIAVTGLIRPPLIRRYGNALLFGLSGLGLGMEALILGLAQALPVTWLAGAVGGVSLGLFQVTAFGLIMESTPPDCYESYVSVQASAGNFAIFASPLVTSGLLSLGAPLGMTLLVSAGVRAVAGLLSLIVFRHVKRPPIGGERRPDGRASVATQ